MHNREVFTCPTETSAPLVDATVAPENRFLIPSTNEIAEWVKRVALESIS